MARAENNRSKHAVSARPVEPESQRKMFRVRRLGLTLPATQPKDTAKSNGIRFGKREMPNQVDVPPSCSIILFFLTRQSWEHITNIPYRIAEQLA
jgi:hypothetical protein